MKYCPKCEADISHSYQETEDDVGIVGGWYCDACDLGITDEGDDDDDNNDMGDMT